jgi:Kinase binding protein CGI-121
LILKITEAIRRYGISKGNVDVIVVKIGSSELSPAEEKEKMKEVIDGTLVHFTELGDVTDWSSIKKVCVIDFFSPVRSLITHLLFLEVSQAQWRGGHQRQ